MKEKLHIFKEKYPILLSFIIAILWIVTLLVSGIIFALIPFIVETGNGYTHQLITDLVGTILGVVLILLFGYKKVFKERKYGAGKEILTGLYPIIAGVIVIISTLYLYVVFKNFPTLLQGIQGAEITYSVQPASNILIFTVTMILIGTAEEFTFRGLIANLIFDKYGKTSKGVWFSTFMTGLIFASIHLFNAISPDISLFSATIQAIFAGVLGMVFTVIYYRTRNIWFLVFLHAYNNFAALFGSGVLGQGTIDSSIASYSFFNLIGIIPYIIVILVLLRKSKMEEILEIV